MAGGKVRMDARVIRIPREHQEVFCLPRPAQLSSMVAENVALLSQCDPVLPGISFADARREARRAVLTIAAEHSAVYEVTSTPSVERPIVMTGHQTEFFHPGVWIKNFLAGRLAQHVGATPLNVLLDSDAATHTGFRVPADGEWGARCETFVFADADPATPYELIPLDARRARRTLAAIEQGVAPTPMAQPVRDFVVAAEETLASAKSFARFAAGARRRIESAWDLHNLEFPVSQACRTRAFAQFLLWIASSCDRFREIYNEHLHAYRRTNRIRTSAHPMPDLDRAGGACELPFWVIRHGRRRRLWMDKAGASQRLTDGEKTLVVLGVDPARSLADAMEKGLQVRPRAIANTMFFRLFVADVFIHGIGGSRYDTITDCIIRDFAGCDPPPFVVVSATAFLPFQARSVVPDDILKTRRHIRDTYWNAQRYLEKDARRRADVRGLLVEKRALLDAMPNATHGERRSAYERILAVTARLGSQSAPARRSFRDQLERLGRLARDNDVLLDRTYPFALYPRDVLETMFTFDFAGPPGR